jgi:hypothetical protein
MPSATTRPREVDVIFVHGVSGPSPGWQPALLSAVHRWWPIWAPKRAEPTLRLRTIRYDGNFRADTFHTDNADSRLHRAVAATARRRNAVPASTRRARRARLLEAVELAGSREAAPVALPPPVVGELLLRVPGVGMDQARAYRHDPEVARRVRATVAGALASSAGYRVVIAHSLGSIVTLEALHAHRLAVDLLVTIGSPLGADVAWRRDAITPEGFRWARAGAWLNVVNLRDPVPWRRGVQEWYPQAVDAYISAGRLPVGAGGAHDPATYLDSDVVGAAISATLSTLRGRRSASAEPTSHRRGRAPAADQGALDARGVAMVPGDEHSIAEV